MTSKLSTDGEKAIPTCARLKNQDVFKGRTTRKSRYPKRIMMFQALGYSNLQILVIFLAPTKPHHLIGLPLCCDTTTNSPCLKAPSAPGESSTCAALLPSMRFHELHWNLNILHASWPVNESKWRDWPQAYYGILKICLCLNLQQLFC